MNYAVVKLQGHQEIVNPNAQNLIVDLIAEKEGFVIKPQVLLTCVEGKMQIGTPTVNFPIELEVVRHQKGDKIYVAKYHAKARTRRRIGFRPRQTVLKVMQFGEKAIESKKIKVEKVGKAIGKNTSKAVKIVRKTITKKSSKKTTTT